MDEFNIKNIYKYWLKKWPLTVALLIIGIAAGVHSARNLYPTYEARTELLVQNSMLDAATTEYVEIANGDMVSEKNKDDSCTINNSEKGNIITIAVSCLNSKEKSENIMRNVVNDFKTEVENIYSEARIKIHTIVDVKITENSISMTDRFKKFLLPVIITFAASVAIAFISLDYKTSKK